MNPTREHKVKKGWMKRDGVGWGVVKAGRKSRHCETGRRVIDLSEGSIAVGGRDRLSEKMGLKKERRKTEEVRRGERRKKGIEKKEQRKW